MKSPGLPEPVAARRSGPPGAPAEEPLERLARLAAMVLHPLCGADHRPRQWSGRDVATLWTLAEVAAGEVALQAALRHGADGRLGPASSASTTMAASAT